LKVWGWFTFEFGRNLLIPPPHGQAHGGGMGIGAAISVFPLGPLEDLYG